jgi:hypothetical protein
MAFPTRADVPFKIRLVSAVIRFVISPLPKVSKKAMFCRCVRIRMLTLWLQRSQVSLPELPLDIVH